ncbi:MAG: class I SAM-dependent methyltransferase [Treponema sp.]|nr:class I SAM-dependent methyltransferase [Treponema sp.]
MAKVQDILAVIDGPKSCRVHNFAGRVVGSISKPYNPMCTLFDAAKMLKTLKAGGGGRVFFEYGTGWVPTLPIGFWLGGAEKTITVDANTYMQKQYVTEAVGIIVKNAGKIKEVYGNLLDEKRLNALADYAAKNNINIKELLELCRIEYMAPTDAACTGLPDKSVDAHVSHFAFEHIPPDILKAILLEGGRIIKPNGLFINTVDYQDHFAVYTKTIHRLNFLQYSDEEWEKYNSNKYTYVNRMRHEDFLKLFAELGHEIIYMESNQDESIKKLLDSGQVKLDKKYQAMSKDTLPVMGAWFVSRIPF